MLTFSSELEPLNHLQGFLGGEKVSLVKSRDVLRMPRIILMNLTVLDGTQADKNRARAKTKIHDYELLVPTHILGDIFEKLLYPLLLCTSSKQEMCISSFTLGNHQDALTRGREIRMHEDLSEPEDILKEMVFVKLDAAM
ncbi:hypothetical protein C5167_041626 [Papaver somniferum]|nr:hypothetical protein C5167_041626 [Papaver somniferum]